MNRYSKWAKDNPQKAEQQKTLSDLQAEIFPEEFDYIYDDGFDAKRRARGENPMNQDYINLRNANRRSLGVKPYGVTPDSPKVDHDAMADESFISSEAYCTNLLNQE